MSDIGDGEKTGVFYNRKSFSYEDFHVNQYMKKMLGLKFYLLKVDRQSLPKNKIYGKYLPEEKFLSEPIELFGNVNLQKAEPAYANEEGKSVLREKYGVAIFKIPTKQLREKDLEILEGDYIKYYVEPESPQYFEIRDANYYNDTNNMSRARLDSFIRKIKAVHVFRDVIKEPDNDDSDHILL